MPPMPVVDGRQCEQTPRSLKEEPGRILHEEMLDLCRRYSVIPTPRLELTHRLRTTAGMCGVAGLQKPTIQTLIIRLNLNYLEVFGFERLRRCFLHEMAHVICIVHHRDTAHSARFKRICRELGGTLNSRLGGDETRYINEPVRWTYTCLCGSTWQRRRRLNADSRRQYCCSHCRTGLEEWRESRVPDVGE
jgi:predicted SprT family Zn-dependent metalloprotease